MFTASMETNNADFDGGEAEAVAERLEYIAYQLRLGWTEGRIKDNNGNTVGGWFLTDTDKRPEEN